MSGLAALVCTGCLARGNVDLLESQLRQHEDQFAAYEKELESLRQELQTARNESQHLRKQVESAGQIALVSEQVELLARVREIRFSPLLTTGWDNSDAPGHEGISVLVMPVDGDGDLVKIPGAIELQLLDLTLPPSEQHLGRWKFTIDETRPAWHRGLLCAGYLFQLPWQTVPKSTSLTLHATLRAPDGRRFDATTKLAVQLPEEAAAPALLPEAKGTSAVQTSDRFTDITIPRLR